MQLSKKKIHKAHYIRKMMKKYPYHVDIPMNHTYEDHTSKYLHIARENFKYFDYVKLPGRVGFKDQHNANLFKILIG